MSMCKQKARIGCCLGLVIGLLVAMGVIFLSPTLKTAIVHPLTLKSLPVPPGAIDKTEWLAPGTEIADWKRGYKVDQPYTEVVGFFQEQLPKRGWILLDEEETMHDEKFLGTGETIIATRMNFEGAYIFQFTIQVMVVSGFKDGEQVRETTVTIYDHPQ